MKKIVFFIVVLSMAISCLGDGPNYQSSYTLSANFEYSTLNYPQVFGEDSLYFDAERCVGFGYQDLGFHHKLNADTTEVLGGFLMSYLETRKDMTQLDPKTNRWRALAAPDMRNTYAVHRTADLPSNKPAHDVEFLNIAYGTCAMANCQVTNTVEVADSIRTRFAVGDKLILKATGYLNGAKTGSAEFMLAERASVRDSIVSTWTTFDLSALGAVEYVDFEMVVLSANAVDLPKFFCLDNLTASVNISY